MRERERDRQYSTDSLSDGKMKSLLKQYCNGLFCCLFYDHCKWQKIKIRNQIFQSMSHCVWEWLELDIIKTRKKERKKEKEKEKERERKKER